MSDIPTVQQRAAEVVLLRVAGIIGYTRGSSYDKAERLAAAGLLADPATSRTDAEQAVIDAAIALIEKASESAGCNIAQGDLLPLARAIGILERDARPVGRIIRKSAAVDRLTATEETT